ncbi:MAG: glycosyltransferase [bacterium]|nr:glycosyltransferase [bacterium]
MKICNSPLISIVIPSLNQGQFIEQAIASVIGQNYPNIELIIIDGGSSDNTADVIKHYERNIAYYLSESDNGQAQAINKGFDVAKGDILAWLNADDLYMPCTFSKIASIIDNTDKPILAYGGCIYFHEDRSTACSYHAFPFSPERLTYKDYIFQPSTFWSKRLWETVGKLNESYQYILDWEWFIRASKVASWVPVGNYLSLYRFHESHKTSSGFDKRQQEILKVVETYAPQQWISAYKDVYKYITSTPYIL